MDHNKFTEDDIKRTGLPKDVMELIHDLCYHVNNNLRGTLDARAIENYVLRAQEILRVESNLLSVSKSLTVRLELTKQLSYHGNVKALTGNLKWQRPKQ